METTSRWQRRSWSVSVGAGLIAACVLLLTSWYLWESLPHTLPNLALAVMVVIGPLLTRWPITAHRCLVAAGIWFLAGGVPGGYIFGASVFLGAPVLVASTLISAWLMPSTEKSLEA